tara:strand:+ start:137 stop:595 length:459 start_codon:yes stop_codon:yes gene_type:complete
MYDTILTVTYLCGYLYFIFKGKEADFNHISEGYKKSLFRRCLFISYMSLLFAAIGIFLKSYDVIILTVVTMSFAIICTFIRLLQEPDVLNKAVSHAKSAVFHSFVLIPVLYYLYYNCDNLKRQNINTTIISIAIFTLFYLSIHGYIYENALF